MILTAGTIMPRARTEKFQKEPCVQSRGARGWPVCTIDNTDNTGKLAGCDKLYR
jgi:hypothetical protein